MRTYTSAGERLDPDAFEEVAAGRPVPETPRLLRRWVVLGMPPRYARPPGAPGAVGSVVRGLLRGAARRLRDRRCSDRVH